MWWLVMFKPQAKPIWVQIPTLSSKSHVALDRLFNPLLSVPFPSKTKAMIILKSLYVFFTVERTK